MRSDRHWCQCRCRHRQINIAQFLHKITNDERKESKRKRETESEEKKKSSKEFIAALSFGIFNRLSFLFESINYYHHTALIKIIL